MGYRWWVAVACGLFAVGLIAGLFTPPDAWFPSELRNYLQSLAGNVAPYHFSTALSILGKNLLSLLLSFALSPLLLLCALAYFIR